MLKCESCGEDKMLEQYEKFNVCMICGFSWEEIDEMETG